MSTQELNSTPTSEFEDGINEQERIRREEVNEAEINIGQRIIQRNVQGDQITPDNSVRTEEVADRSLTREEGLTVDAAYRDRDYSESRQVSISEEDIIAKIKDFERDIYTYDESVSLFQNQERGKAKIQEMGQYLRPFGELTPRILEAVKRININRIKPPRNSIMVNNLLTSKVQSAKISGDSYMSIFKAQKYLLNIQQDITEIKNFFYVIDKNNASILLKNFKDNKQALINIIVGLVKIAFAYKSITIKYERSYDLIYKNQTFDNVVFDFDSYKAFGDYVFLKKIVTDIQSEDGEIEQNINIVKIRLLSEDFKRVDLKVKNENARSTENMVVAEVPEEFELEVFESKDYESAENLEFSKEILEAFIKNDEFKNKIFDFINGAFLIYPEILEHLPENIILKREDFKIFDYLESQNNSQVV